MKRAKSFLVGALTLALAFGAVGCKSKTTPDTATDIQIYYWKSGLGLEFMQEIVDKFNARQSSYTAHLDYDSNATTIISSLSLGSENTYDLYFTMLNNMVFQEDFILLDDMLDKKADGESKTIGEKYNPQVLNALKNADGTTNFLSYGNGWCGIAYNTDIVDGTNYLVPVTTNELEALTMDLASDPTLTSKNVKPWIFFRSANAGYWKYSTTAWQVQYDGLDYYNNNFLTLTDEEGNSPSKDVLLKKDGRYEALTVVEKILTPTTVHPESTNTNHTKVQTLFLQGKAVMMPNGSWLLSESTGTANVSMMKIPVISSIINKLPDRSVEDDSELAALVRAIDEGNTQLRSDNYTYEVTQADYDFVKAARNLMYNNGSEEYVFIPKYSNAIDGAKEFLRYFYSDEALQIYLDNVGCMNALSFSDESKADYSKLDDWGRRQTEFSRTLTAVTNPLTRASFFINSGVDSIMDINYPTDFSNTNPSQRKFTDDIWNTLLKKVNENWEAWN